jgi:23S rRNA (adenine2503-C2)-methyltransferase
VLALQAVTPEKLASVVPGVTLAEARKLVARVHRGEPIAATSAVRRTAADAVRAAGQVPQLAVVTETASAVDPFVKYLVEAPDGARVEAVRIPLEVAGRFSACVSSQVGCALACAFCATGRLGLSRNLEAWEIVEQVRIIRARLPDRSSIDRRRGALGPADRSSIDRPRVPRSGVPSGQGALGPADRSSIDRPRVHGVVFQGMGEPMANVDAVLDAIAVLTEPCALGIDARAITVCTAGLPHGIRRLAAAQPKVRLGLSIGSARDAVRRDVMPIARAHDFSDVIAAVADHARATGLSPMFAVTLLDGVNDGDADAHALAELATRFAAGTQIRPRISIIAYNTSGAADPFRRSAREAAFRGVLADAGLASHRRYSGGADIAAACGQLVAAG